MKISDLWEDTGFFDREPMFIYDYYSFEIFDVNKAALEQYGFSKEEFLKKRFIDLGRKISIDDFPDIDKNKFNPSAIWIHQDKKKQEFFIQLTSHLINYRGKPTQLSVAHVVDHLFKKNKNLSLLPRIESVRAHVPMAMIEWDKKFNIRDWSDQANKIFGWDSESVRGKNLFDIGILPAEERNIYQANLENFISNGKNYYSSESESFTKKGEKIYCIWHNAAIYNVDRKLISMYSLVEDITDKRVAEKQLKESEHRFRVITEASLVGIFMIQGEKFKYVNPSFSRMTGYSTKELVHKKEPFQLIHEDDQSKLYELKSKWDTGEIESFDAELKAIKKQGEIIHVRVYGSKILLDEQPAVIGVVVDETDRIRTHQNYKESLESYKALFNSIHDAMYILDKDGKFIEVNQGAMDMYGFPKDKFIGNTPEILAAPGKVDMEQTNQFMKNVFEGSVEQFEWWGKKKNGEVFLKEVQLNPGTYFGKPVVIAIARDISDRYERDLEIRQNEELFRQLFQNAPV
ncbi:MAG: PAS domain-containing protein, partial [Balneolaceae bacterium]